MKSARTERRRRLSSKQINFLKARLLEKRRELLAKLQSGERELRSDAYAPGDDFLDRALESVSREATFQMAEIKSAAVEQIDGAIEKIQEGTYGVCEMCGEGIPAARLKALPSATLCVTCKSAEERQAGPGGYLPRGQFLDVQDESFDPETIYGSVRGTKVS